MEIEKLSFWNWLHQYKDVKKENYASYSYRMQKTNIRCMVVLSIIAEKTIYITIYPMNVTHDIGSGAGMCITKIFKRRKNSKY